jgi:S-DNA-T family DNA segregation ATPase FtsK/SpoIIIE
VGLLDDPAGQCRRPLRWRPDDGTLLLVGAVGSGTTTAASAVVAQCARMADPDALHLYVIDAHGAAAWTAFEASAHCGAVVRVTETERVSRLLARLAEELDRRSGGASCEPVIVVVIDGYSALRDSVGDVAHGEAARRLDRLLRDGPVVGMVAVVTTDGASSAGLAVPRAATWRFDAGVPGRMRAVESGLEGQVVFDPDAGRSLPRAGRAPRTGPCAGRAAPVLVLPDVVDPDEFDARVAVCASEGAQGRPVELPIGLGADDLEPSWLRVPVGDHVFIGGAARTGRSTALRQVAYAWRRAHPGGAVVRVGRHRPLDIDAAALDDPGIGEPGDDDPRIGGLGSVLVVVDDAERVDDPDGALTRLLARPRVTFAVAARLEAVRVAYGHWTREVARGRCGLIMTSMGEVDGELLGATLPRRSMIPPRPGLAWIIDHDGQRLVQVAARMLP